MDENGLKPRDEAIALESEFNSPGQYAPITWEGCVVKLSDKIAYIGRDIEDATALGFLDEDAQNELKKMAQTLDQKAINSTVIMHNLIIDVCQNSSPEKGICLSNIFMEQLNVIKKFNYEKIYNNKRFDAFKKYSELILTQLFEVLYQTYDGKHSFDSLNSIKKYYPTLVSTFENWLLKYCDSSIVPNGKLKDDAFRCLNKRIYGKLENAKLYAQAIIDYIAGMTDRFAVKLFNELITY